MPNRDPKINKIATSKAREAWMISPAQTSVRGRLRIPSDLIDTWEKQNTGDRGMSWAIGFILSSTAARYIVGNDEVTVILGQHSATASNQYEAVAALVQSYGHEMSQSDGLDARLNELGLLE